MDFNKDNYLTDFFFDNDIIFKVDPNDEKNKLKIFPIKVNDYFNFFSLIDIFVIEKNRIPDPKVISMSYMDYILNKISEEVVLVNNMKLEDRKQEYYMTYLKFYELLRICMGIEYNDVKYGKKENGKYALYLKNIEISKYEFDEMRGIICEQNLVDVPDEKIDPKFKKALDEARYFKDKNNAKMGSLEDQMICLMSEYHYDIEKIKGLTVRKFQKMLERADFKMHYKIYKEAEMQGTQFKTKIDHWMSEIVKNKYADLIVDYDDTMSKFEGKPSK